jgi:hypothetical protein
LVSLTAASVPAAPCGSVMVPRKEAGDWESPVEATASRPSSNEHIGDERRKVFIHISPVIFSLDFNPGIARDRLAGTLIPYLR